MITRINIQGYKSIKSMDLNLGSINILLGANGVGKSNFVSVFSLVKYIYNQNLQNYVQSKGGPDTLLHFGRKITKEVVFQVVFKNKYSAENIFKITLGAIENKIIIRETKTAYKTNNKWYPRVYENNVYESNFSKIFYGQAFYVNDRLAEFEVYHFHDTSDSSPMKSISNISDNFRLKPDASNLAAYLYLLKVKHTKHFQRIEKNGAVYCPVF